MDSMVCNERADDRATKAANRPSRFWLTAAAGLLALLAACGSSDQAVTAAGEQQDAPAVADEFGADQPAPEEAPDFIDEEALTEDDIAPRPLDLDALTAQVWTLRFGGGPGGEITPVDGYPITITFDGDGSISGIASCNGYGGRYEIDGSEIFLPQIDWTEVGCEPDVQAAEGAFFSALTNVTNIDLFGDEMALSGPESELIFAPAESAPAETGQ